MYLVSKDSKGKIRVANINLSKVDSTYVITRETGQYNGKITSQPSIVIEKGKAKRTLEQQADLQFNSKVKEYLDKGYKALDKDINEFTEDQLNELVGTNKTDNNGFKKHMLAKQAKDVSDKVINKLKYWWASRKIDGTRCSFYCVNGVIKSASRGGGDYDISTTLIRNHPKFVELFTKYPNLVLDGELYKHGKSLQQISGAVRKEEPCEWLEYYIYDIQEDLSFEKRLAHILEIQEFLNAGFDPNREWKDDELKVQFVPHEKVSGKDNIIKLHDKYVSEGWEGCVVRDPSATYQYGGRGSVMLKFKMYQDAEFKITGLSEGLREEDMCFTLVTDGGIEFKAKPMGSRELKEQYRKDLDSLIGKYATVKFFYLSDDGTPLQPVLKAIRDYE